MKPCFETILNLADEIAGCMLRNRFLPLVNNFHFPHPIFFWSAPRGNLLPIPRFWVCAESLFTLVFSRPVIFQEKLEKRKWKERMLFFPFSMYACLKWCFEILASKWKGTLCCKLFLWTVWLEAVSFSYLTNGGSDDGWLSCNVIK